jgi:hypothetical protein
MAIDESSNGFSLLAGLAFKVSGLRFPYWQPQIV